MLGFVIGTLCLIGLVKVVRAGRCRGQGWSCGEHRHGWHGGWRHGRGHDWQRGRGWGGGGWDGGGCHGGWGDGRWGGGRWGGGRWGWMRGLFERLDTSPGQEKVIKQSIEEVFSATRVLRGELDESRREIAGALRGGVVDEARMGELFARHDDTLREVRKAMVGALARVSDALDEDQRRQLADLIERGALGGGFGRFRGGPYREPGRGPGGGEWA